MDNARTYLIEREQWIARPIEEVFAFHGDATNLEAITPEWLRFSVITPAPIAMGAGTLIEYRLRWHRLPLRWTTLIEAWEPPHRFVDTQLRGPYRLWHHTHTFEARDGGTTIRDEVRYRLPLGWLGAALHRLGIRRDLEDIFDARARRVRELLEPGPGPTVDSPADRRRGISTVEREVMARDASWPSFPTRSGARKTLKREFEAGLSRDRDGP